MGSLSELTIPTTEVAVGDKTLTIRGLSFTDMTEIFRDHAATLESLFQKHIVEKDEMPPADQLARALMSEAPAVVAQMIANANDEPDEADVVSKLPAVVQAKALAEMAALTFQSEAEVKELLEKLIQGTGVLSSLLGIVGDQTTLPEA